MKFFRLFTNATPTDTESVQPEEPVLDVAATAENHGKSLSRKPCRTCGNPEGGGFLFAGNLVRHCPDCNSLI
jgi:hypothetical protein